MPHTTSGHQNYRKATVADVAKLHPWVVERLAGKTPAYSNIAKRFTIKINATTKAEFLALLLVLLFPAPPLPEGTKHPQEQLLTRCFLGGVWRWVVHGGYFCCIEIFHSNCSRWG